MEKADDMSDYNSLGDDSEYQLELFKGEGDSLSPQLKNLEDKNSKLKKINLEFFEAKKHLNWKKRKKINKIIKQLSSFNLQAVIQVSGQLL